MSVSSTSGPAGCQSGLASSPGTERSRVDRHRGDVRPVGGRADRSVATASRTRLGRDDVSMTASHSRSSTLDVSVRLGAVGEDVDGALRRRTGGAAVQARHVVAQLERPRRRSAAAHEPGATEHKEIHAPRMTYGSSVKYARPPRRARMVSWTGASSGSRTSTASPARSGASGGCRPTRSPATCSGGSSPGAAPATSSCATAPASTSTSAPTRSTPPPSATRSPTWSPTTRRGSGSSRACSSTPRSGCTTRASPGDIYLFKNNTDSAGNSYGCHENYLVARHGEFGRLADVLIPFLVTRQLICGAGKVLQTPRGAVYCLSQRAEHIWEGVSSAPPPGRRPIINTRDEPHADAERYRRLHVIVGDSNMNESPRCSRSAAPTSCCA